MTIGAGGLGTTPLAADQGGLNISLLISPDDCADLLGISSSDTLLNHLVIATDAWVRRSLSREFIRASRVEVVRGFNHTYVVMRESPIRAITEVRIDECGRFPSTSIISDLTQFTFDPDPAHDDSRIFYLNGKFPTGFRVAQITYEAGWYSPNDPVNVGDMPSDLQERLIERVAAKYKQGTDEEMKSETQGDRNWTKFQETDARILAALSRYRRVTLF